jgi:hypothetical protein
MRSSCGRSAWVFRPIVPTPVASRRLSPATRTMKNSSRLVAKIAKNRTRSSSGSSLVSASSSTRSFQASQLSSRSMKRADTSLGSDAIEALTSSALIASILAAPR